MGLLLKELHGKNAVEVILSDELSRKHPVFPFSLIKPYSQRNETEITLSTPIALTKDPINETLKIQKILK